MVFCWPQESAFVPFLFVCSWLLQSVVWILILFLMSGYLILFILSFCDFLCIILKTKIGDMSNMLCDLLFFLKVDEAGEKKNLHS